METYYLGIDVSKDSLDVVLLAPGQSPRHQVYTNCPTGFARLARWLVSQHVSTLHVCLEATGQYGDGVAEYFFQRNDAVSMVNPARIKHYAQSKLHRNKTDKADAALIAEFCAKERPPRWQPLPTHLKQLRELVRRLDDLQTNSQQERNRLSSGGQNALVLADLRDHLTYLQERMQALKQAIQDLIASQPELQQQAQLLESIPGIGALTAARLLAEIGEVSRFQDAPQLAAYAGLNPRGASSGSSVRKKTRLSKEGRAFLRYILYMPAMVARKHNPIIRTFCKRLAERKLPEMAILAAAMRKLLHLVFGILKHGVPFDPDYLNPSPVPS